MIILSFNQILNELVQGRFNKFINRTLLKKNYDYHANKDQIQRAKNDIINQCYAANIHINNR